MARDLGVSEFSVRKAVKEAGPWSLARTKRFMLTDKLKASRLEKCKKIRSILKKKKTIILFSDEKYLTVNPDSNSHHDRFISSLKVSNIPDKVKFVPQAKHPSQIMIFGLVSSGGKKTTPVFLHSGLKMGAQDYVKRVLKFLVLPWVLANYPEPANYVFMNFVSQGQCYLAVTC